MSPYCSAPLDLTTNHDIIAACIQAEAGFAQAAGSIQAAWITAGAGAFVLVAAVMGARATVQSVREQIAAATREQAKQRAQDLKREVFTTAIDAVAAGMQSIIRLASLHVHLDEAIKPYIEQTVPRLLTLHLVATPEMARKWQRLVIGMGKGIGNLTVDRPIEPVQVIGLEGVISWNRKCTAELPEIIDASVAVLADMRAEIEMPFDKDQYRQIIVEGYNGALENNEELYRKLFLRFNGQI